MVGNLKLEKIRDLTSRSKVGFLSGSQHLHSDRSSGSELKNTNDCHRCHGHEICQHPFPFPERQVEEGEVGGRSARRNQCRFSVKTHEAQRSLEVCHDGVASVGATSAVEALQLVDAFTDVNGCGANSHTEPAIDAVAFFGSSCELLSTGFASDAVVSKRTGKRILKNTLDPPRFWARVLTNDF